ncbi:hypothetical protein KIN20_007691 [Parelaphostrongylus tenuis]|uniref:Uncharacterized protein n=1 Tax=Parelaphostrongylus tenuis TaxID=148309 RepID=A0AAD5MLR1_PARTN|nr:hypothetical protein KIN20_007691 [Parelaphostrongylus tenuis]
MDDHNLPITSTLATELDVIADCHGVTFTGVIAPRVGEPNCLLVGCSDDRCEMNEPAEYPDGLVSVVINRTQREMKCRVKAPVKLDEKLVDLDEILAFSASQN